jgi:hypothetical protein
VGETHVCRREKRNQMRVSKKARSCAQPVAIAKAAENKMLKTPLKHSVLVVLMNSLSTTVITAYVMFVLTACSSSTGQCR